MMPVTEEEKKIARAYNAGYVLSTYEPRLMAQIIRDNRNNEFVQVMDVAREHHDFNRGIPRKYMTPEYKNGFHNARSLSENDPKLLDKLITAPKMNKEYINGLKSGKKEYEVLQTLKTMSKDTGKGNTGKDNTSKETRRNPEEDKLYLKGFNYGYKFSRDDPQFLSEVLTTEKEYRVFVDGMRAGQDEFNKGGIEPPVSKQLSEEQQYQKGFNQGYLVTKHEPKLADRLSKTDADTPQLDGMKDGKEQQLQELYKETRPSWMKEDPFTEDKEGPGKDIDKDINMDHDNEPER